VKNASEIFMEVDHQEGEKKKRDKKKDKKKASADESEHGIDLEA